MLLVGVFVGIIVGIILLGDLVGDGESAEASEAHSMIEENIQPVGQVAVTGDPTPTPAPVAVAQVPAVAAAAPTDDDTNAEIADIDARLNALQSFLQNAGASH